MDGEEPVSSDIREKELLIHRLYRERIVEEDNLINHRMMWMILSQAFVMAFWAALAQKLYDDHGYPALRYPMGIIAIIGGVFAIGSFYSIHAARREIQELRDKYRGMYQSSDTPRNQLNPNLPIADNRLPGLTGSKHNHRAGHIVPVCMPWLLFVVWIGLIFFTIWGQYFQ